MWEARRTAHLGGGLNSNVEPLPAFSDDAMPAFAGNAFAGGEPDSAGSASNDCDLAFKFARHGYFLFELLNAEFKCIDATFFLK